MFKDRILSRVLENIQNFGDRNAFFIEGKAYSYAQFGKTISNIRKLIESLPFEEKIIGLVPNNDLETYAAIWALWLEGKAYVPLSKKMPFERNATIINQVQINTILDSSVHPHFANYKTISTYELEEVELNLKVTDSDESSLVYVLFTSGSTGYPKAIPINQSNLAAFVSSFESLGYSYSENDRCLQMFELTFDLSIFSYLLPLLNGACVYTVPEGQSKFVSAAEIIEEQKLTIMMMVPSVLQYLRPYFSEIDCPDIKYSFFCGESLHQDLVEEWINCIPNAEIINVYGPTENTIVCTHYSFNKNENKRVYNGVLSIGKTMPNNNLIIVDENFKQVSKGEKGQLCIAGPQLMCHYLANDEKNKDSFFTIEYNGELTKFYKTGDLCYFDNDDYINFLGRIDFQTKIQGFRVELTEVEFHAKKNLPNTNIIALAFVNEIGNTELGLIIESEQKDITNMIKEMQYVLPDYMIPTKIKFSAIFPLNLNGKIDRKILVKEFENIKI